MFSGIGRYGDIGHLWPTGASEMTARGDRLTYSGKVLICIISLETYLRKATEALNDLQTASTRISFILAHRHVPICQLKLEQNVRLVVFSLLFLTVRVPL